jgi:predicted DNA-binding transcriptional regulator AlpA
MSRQVTRAAADTTAEFLTDPEGATLLNLGETRFLEVQKEPDFPAPVWLGPRGKRHVRSELLTWAMSQRRPQRQGK